MFRLRIIFSRKHIFRGIECYIGTYSIAWLGILKYFRDGYSLNMK